MNLASMRIITDDVEKLASFYELICGAKAQRYSPVFAELRTPSCTLAFGGTPHWHCSMRRECLQQHQTAL